MNLSERDRRALILLAAGLAVLFIVYLATGSSGSSTRVVQPVQSIERVQKQLETLRKTAATLPARQEIHKKVTAELADREALLSIYGQETLSDPDVARVQSIFELLDVKTRVQALADDAHRQAIMLAGAIHFTDEGRGELLSLVNFLLERDH